MRLHALWLQPLCWFTRRFQGFRGVWRIVGWLEQRPKLLANCRPTQIRTAAGARMVADPRDYGGMLVFICGAYQGKQFASVYNALIHAGDVVIDVGANIGALALFSATLVGPSGCVHAFEASPMVAVLLRRNVALNPDLVVTVHGKAVADKCGSTTFFTAVGGNLGLSSIRDIGQKGNAIQATVPTVSLDSMLAELGPVTFVKIDVEGAEHLVLKGMAALIRRDRPYILMEVDDSFLREAGSNAAAVHRYLTEAGYSVYQVEFDGLRVVRRAPTRHCDVLCVHAEKALPPELRVVGECPAS